MTAYPHLLSPIKVGAYTYRNRVEAAPTVFGSLVLIPPIKDRIIRMIEDRAKGGCAAVVTGEVPVNFDDAVRPSGKFGALTWDYEDYTCPAFKVFAENAASITAHGSLAIAELSHIGIEKPLLEDGVHPLGPVAYTKPDGTEVHAFTRETMDKVANDFAVSAAFFQAAGFQGVFLHYGHGWLISQFLNVQVNTRTDEYGGSLENRARFPLEILRAVRERCGKDFLIEIRVSGREGVPGGVELEETVEFCRILDEAGIVDLFHVSTGHYFSPARSNEFSTGFRPNGLNADAAAAIKAVVSVPVAVVGGISTPELAEEIIASGKADIVSMGREMIADPEFVAKAARGEGDRVRECLRCCVCYPGPTGEHSTDPESGHLPELGSCTVNPYNVTFFSHHTVMPEDMPAPTGSRRVLVIGGGPGGMQAAIDASDRGHQVTLIDDAERLGGVLRLTDTDHYKKALLRFKNQLAREVGRRPIDVRLNTVATPELVKEFAPEALIVAIGGSAIRPAIPGIEKAITGFETFFCEPGQIGQRVVMIGGGLVGCEAGIDLAAKGHQVTVVELRERLVADNIGIHRTALLDEMDRVGVQSVLNSRCIAINDDGVVIEGPDGKELILPADTVVIGLGSAARKGEAAELVAAAGDVPTFVIGDADHTARVGEAVSSGYRAAMAIL